MNLVFKYSFLPFLDYLYILFLVYISYLLYIFDFIYLIFSKKYIFKILTSLRYLELCIYVNLNFSISLFIYLIFLSLFFLFLLRFFFCFLHTDHNSGWHSIPFQPKCDKWWCHQYNAGYKNSGEIICTIPGKSQLDF